MKITKTITLASLLALAGATSFAQSNYFYVNGPTKWYDFDAFTAGGNAVYTPLAGTPTDTDNLTIYGYTNGVVPVSGGTDTAGDSIYRFGASLNFGSFLEVKNLTYNIDTGYQFHNGSTNGTIWTNMDPNASIVVHGTLLNSGTHDLTFNNGNAADGYTIKAAVLDNNGIINMQSGIKALYIGTLDGTTVSATRSTNAAGATLNVNIDNKTAGSDSASDIYIGNLDNYGTLSLNGTPNHKSNLYLLGELNYANNGANPVLNHSNIHSINGGRIVQSATGGYLNINNSILHDAILENRGGGQFVMDKSTFADNSTTTVILNTATTDVNFEFRKDVVYNSTATINIEAKQTTWSEKLASLRFNLSEAPATAKDAFINSFVVENTKIDLWVGKNTHLYADTIDLLNSATGGASLKGTGNAKERFNTNITINNLIVDGTSNIGFGSESFIFDSVTLGNVVNNGDYLMIRADKVKIGTMSGTKKAYIESLGGINVTGTDLASSMSFQSIDIDKLAFSTNDAGIMVAPRPYADPGHQAYYDNDAMTLDVNIKDLGKYGSISIENGITNKTVNLVLNIDNSAGRQSFEGIIKDTENGTHLNKMNIIKTGEGKQVLIGSGYSFQGTIDVQEGTLLMNYSNSDMGKVTVDGGFFGRAGGQLYLTALELKDGGFAYDLNYANYTLVFDSISDLSFDLSEALDANNFLFYNLAQFIENGNDRAILFDFDDGAALTAELAALVDETGIYEGIYEATFGYDAIDGFFYVEFVVIPEPSTYAAIFGLLALAFAAYRRRK